jgi:hypothetical protein
MAGFGSFLCSILWCISLITLLGFSRYVSQPAVGMVLIGMVVPSIAGYIYGWFARASNRMSKAPIVLGPLFFFAFLCLLGGSTAGEWTIGWAVASVVSATAAYGVAQIVRQSFAKFISPVNIGLPGCTSLVCCAIWFLLAITNTFGCGQNLNLSDPVSCSIVGLGLVVNTCVVAAAAIARCNTRRWQTSVGTAIAANFMLVAGFLVGIVGCIVRDTFNLLTGQPAPTFALGIGLAVSCILIIAASAATGYAHWLTKRNQSVQPDQLEGQPQSLTQESQVS